MSESKAYIGNMESYFDEFIELYESEKLEFLWNKKGASVGLESNISLGETKRKEFLEFVFDFLRCLQSYALSNIIEEEKFEKYIRTIEERDKYIIEELITKVTSNLNTIDKVNLDKIFKYYGDKKIISSTIRIEYLEPLTQEDSKKVLTLELSKKDIEKLIFNFENILNGWED